VIDPGELDPFDVTDNGDAWHACELCP
jgi:hypothetical protein